MENKQSFDNLSNNSSNIQEPVIMTQIVPDYVPQKIVFVCNNEIYLPKIEQYIEEYFNSTIIVRAKNKNWIDVMVVCCLFDNYKQANRAYKMLTQYISTQESDGELLLNIHKLPVKYAGNNKIISVNINPHIYNRKQEHHETLQGLATTLPEYIKGISPNCIYSKKLSESKF